MSPTSACQRYHTVADGSWCTPGRTRRSAAVLHSNVPAVEPPPVGSSVVAAAKSSFAGRGVGLTQVNVNASPTLSCDTRIE